MKLIIGLGNPGAKYERTRHNIGFWVVDRIAQEFGITLSECIGAALVGRGRCGDEPILLAKPQTYMNRSGESVQALLREFDAQTADMIVVYDDLDLPLGRIRIRAKGSAGGHRGIQSILDGVKVESFTRVRLGIGRPPAGVEPAAFVLEPLGQEARKEFDDLVVRGAEAVRMVLQDGVQRAMERCNQAKLPPDPTL